MKTTTYIWPELLKYGIGRVEVYEEDPTKIECPYDVLADWFEEYPLNPAATPAAKAAALALFIEARYRLQSYRVLVDNAAVCDLAMSLACGDEV